MKKIVYIFGNGNLSYSKFEALYLAPIKQVLQEKNVEFLICDFRGADTLAMEFLKTETAQVSIIHMGEKPRYLPDKYRTKVSQWKVIGGFADDQSRDQYAIHHCTHFIGADFNSNEKRKSGTQKNIEACLQAGKVQLM